MKNDTLVLASIVIMLVIPGFARADSDPAPDCTAHVGYNRNLDLPGFYCNAPTASVCIPFTPTSQRPPADYQGGDFYLREFTDAKLKEKWEACKQDPKCVNQVLGFVKAGLGGIPREFRNTGVVSSIGKIDPHGEVDLTHIRRPAFFGKPPYNEAIGAVDGKTFIVEFTVPRDTYEKLHLNKHNPIKLRGWFIEGEGIKLETGKTTHALAIMIGGRSIETTAIHHPDDPLYTYQATTKDYRGIPYPNERGKTEKWGMRQWRRYLHALNQAGFDVLTIDKRGHGISGGLNYLDTGEQAEDIFRMLDQLESGNGLRVLTPSGELLIENQVAGKLLRGKKAKSIPTLIGGPSLGSMVTIWAMQKNFAEFCSYHLPEPKCSSPNQYGYNIKGALVLADFTAGVAYLDPIFATVEGYLRTVENILFFPSSEILANIDKWPAVFFGRGLWDSYESLEGTFRAYQRATGPKEMVVVRGPHSENEFGDQNVDYLIQKMVAFAKQAVLDVGIKKPGLANLKEVVCSSPPFWEPSSAP